jgi:osmotically-inducible protein OsmY
VFCRQGVVVLAWVVPPGSSAGKRVATSFVSVRSSWTSDLEIKEKIRAALVADPARVSGRVDIVVYAGHVVLVGLVASPQRVQQFEADARSVSGVISVTSFIQTI